MQQSNPIQFVHRCSLKCYDPCARFNHSHTPTTYITMLLNYNRHSNSTQSICCVWPNSSCRSIPPHLWLLTKTELPFIKCLIFHFTQYRPASPFTQYVFRKSMIWKECENQMEYVYTFNGSSLISYRNDFIKRTVSSHISDFNNK